MGVISVNRRHVSCDSVNSSWNHTVWCVADLTHIKVTLWHTYRAGVAMWTTSFLRNSVRIVRNGFSQILWTIRCTLYVFICKIWCVARRKKATTAVVEIRLNQLGSKQLVCRRRTKRSGDFESETTQSETSITLIQSGRGGCDESNQGDGHSIRFYC